MIFFYNKYISKKQYTLNKRKILEDNREYGVFTKNGDNKESTQNAVERNCFLQHAQIIHKSRKHFYNLIDKHKVCHLNNL